MDFIPLKMRPARCVETSGTSHLVTRPTVSQNNGFVHIVLLHGENTLFPEKQIFDSVEMVL